MPLQTSIESERGRQGWPLTVNSMESEGRATGAKSQKSRRRNVCKGAESLNPVDNGPLSTAVCTRDVMSRLVRSLVSAVQRMLA